MKAKGGIGMVKIKVEKKMNLPQLIEWGWGNPSLSRNKRFFSKDENLGITKHCVHFNDFGYPGVDNRYCLEPTDTFTVEVEEEITEDTVIPKMLEKSFDAYQNVVLDIQVNQSINTVKENAEVLTLHVINDDDTHTLIWRDGKLVE